MSVKVEFEALKLASETESEELFVKGRYQRSTLWKTLIKRARPKTSTVWISKEAKRLAMRMESDEFVLMLLQNSILSEDKQNQLKPSVLNYCNHVKRLVWYF